MNYIWSSWCHCHPIISCFIKIQNGLTFMVPAYTGCPGKRGWVYVRMYVQYLVHILLMRSTKTPDIWACLSIKWFPATNSSVKPFTLSIAAQSAGCVFPHLHRCVPCMIPVNSKTKDSAWNGKGSVALFASWPRVDVHKLWSTTVTSVPESLTA